jgi:hypothetical protein
VAAKLLLSEAGLAYIVCRLREDTAKRVTIKFKKSAFDAQGLHLKREFVEKDGIISLTVSKVSPQGIVLAKVKPQQRRIVFPP